jgi:glycosyltransferase involved in cell wall biosynthesis
MRLIYLDPGLLSNLGHHANSCRTFTAELRRRGIEVHVFTHADLPLALQQELRATPLFRAYTYWVNDGDPMSGWLNAFSISARVTTEDIATIAARLGGIRPDDVVYLNSAQAAQLHGLSGWLATLTPANMPEAVLEFGVDPGLDVVSIAPGNIQVSLRDPREDARSVLYRFAACQMAPAVREHLHLTTFDVDASSAYQSLLGLPVSTMPVPREGHWNPARATAPAKPTVAFLGHQRGEKGYHLVPAIVREILRLRPHVRCLVHNGNITDLSEADRELERMASQDPERVILDLAAADRDEWQRRLDRSDLIVLPYYPPRFALSYSAVACEAIACGIPYVAPANTTMARQQRNFGCVDATFAEWTPSSIADAVANLVDRLPEALRAAANGAAAWQRTQGVRHTVDALLRLARVG